MTCRIGVRRRATVGFPIDEPEAEPGGTEPTPGEERGLNRGKRELERLEPPYRRFGTHVTRVHPNPVRHGSSCGCNPQSDHSNPFPREWKIVRTRQIRRKAMAARRSHLHGKGRLESRGPAPGTVHRNTGAVSMEVSHARINERPRLSRSLTCWTPKNGSKWSDVKKGQGDSFVRTRPRGFSMRETTLEKAPSWNDGWEREGGKACNLHRRKE